MKITKEERMMYPKIMTERHFKDGSDTRDFNNQMYAFETVVNNEQEERFFYEGLNHLSNLTIEIKLPNGVIK